MSSTLAPRRTAPAVAHARRSVRIGPNLALTIVAAGGAASFPGVVGTAVVKVFDLVAGFAYTQTVAACLRIDLLALLQREPLDEATIAARLALPLEGLQRLLNAAAALGLLFGLALALILDRLDSRLRTREEVAEALRLPIIGDVPRLKRSERNPGTILSLGSGATWVFTVVGVVAVVVL